MVAIVKIGFANCARTTGAFCDVLSCHLQMHAPSIGTFSLVDLEKAADLFQNQIEWPGFVTRRRGDRVAVHRITRPQHNPALALYRADQWRKKLPDLFGTKPANQRQAAWLIVRIQNLDQPQQVVRFARRAALQSKRILDAARILDMCMIVLEGTVPYP